jgi:hypothetical protein
VYLAAVTVFFLTNAYRPFVSFDLGTRRIASSLNAASVSGSISRQKVAELAAKGIPLAVYREQFEGAVTSWMPVFLVGSVLLFALALAGLFRRQPHGPVAHGVFALHWTAFYLVLTIADRLLGRGPGHASAAGVAVLVIVVVYLILALRRVYARPWPGTIAKGLLLALVFQLLIVGWMFSAIAFAFTIT